MNTGKVLFNEKVIGQVIGIKDNGCHTMILFKDALWEIFSGGFVHPNCQLKPLIIQTEDKQFKIILNDPFKVAKYFEESVNLENVSWIRS
jgi:hypothetical protein